MTRMNHEQVNRMAKVGPRQKKSKTRMTPEWVHFKSKYKGFCGLCIKDILIGDSIMWHKLDKVSYHSHCWKKLYEG